MNAPDERPNPFCVQRRNGMKESPVSALKLEDPQDGRIYAFFLCNKRPFFCLITFRRERGGKRKAVDGSTVPAAITYVR